MSHPTRLRPATAPVVFTGSFLSDGRVAWLAGDGGWSPRIAEARVFPAEAAAAPPQDPRVIGPYAVEVAVVAGVPSPRHVRERLRVTGPSIQAEPAPRPALAG